MRVNSSALVSPLGSSFGTNFSLARSLGLPRFSPGFFGCALRYLALAFLRAFFFLLNSFFSLLYSAMAFRLKRMRIASSPSNWFFITWKQSITMSAFGKTFVTMEYMESE